MASFQPDFKTISGLALSPDGTRVAVYVTEVAQLWDVATGRHVATMKGHTAPITALRFRSDGARILSADGFGFVKEWDVHQLERTNPPLGPAPFTMPEKAPKPMNASSPKENDEFQTSLERAKTSKDGTRTVVAAPLTIKKTLLLRESHLPTSYEKGPTDLRVRDATGKELSRFSAHQAMITFFDVSDDGRYVISMDLARETKIWETATGRVAHTLRWEDQEPLFEPPTFRLGGPMGMGFGGPLGWSSWRFDPTSRRLAASLPDAGVKIWDLNGFTEIFAVSIQAEGVKWSPDGRRIMAASFPFRDPNRESSFNLWDVESKKELYSSSGVPRQISFSRDGQRLALIVSKPHQFKVLNAATGAEVASLDSLAYQGNENTALSPDGNRLALASGADDILILDVDSAKELFRLKGHAKSIGTAVEVRLAAEAGKDRHQQGHVDRFQPRLE